MGKLIDITGQKFGRLTVLNKSDKRNSCGQVYWNCICDCGKTCEVTGTALRTGHTKSCGCYSLDITAEKGKARLVDLTGQKFGKLTVLYRDKTHIKAGGQQSTMWHCLCECGNETSVSYSDLKYNHTRSCGCIKKSYGEDLIQKILTEKNIPFLMEYSFNDCILPSGRKARFDFYVNNKYLIEFDGKQHFDPDAGWGSEKLEDIQLRDQIKNEYCQKKNIPLYRIPYTDVDNLKTINDVLNEKYLMM
jgi:hypothetical protein